MEKSDIIFKNTNIKKNILNYEFGFKMRRAVTLWDDEAYIYVFDWITEEEEVSNEGNGFRNRDVLIAIGCDKNYNFKKIKLSLKPSLFVCTSKFEVLKTVCVNKFAYEQKFINIINTEMTLSCNNYTVLDTLTNAQNVGQSKLIKIEFDTVKDLKYLFNFLKNNNQFYNFVSTTFYWNVTKQIQFELYYKYKKFYNIIHFWVNKNLDIKEYSSSSPRSNLHLTLPLITFDIETVSDDANRLPTGEDENDILFSVSIHYVHTDTLYTFVYLPCECENKKNVLEKSYYEYKYPYVKTHHTRIFTNEKDLLIATMERLTIQGKLHYLIGYNSLKYDIKFLMMRCVFYNIYKDNFFYNDGIQFLYNQIHLDLCDITRIQVKLNNYKLNTLAEEKLKESKVDVDSVLLRHTFRRIQDSNICHSYDENEILNKKNNTNYPCVIDILYYNNKDTILVSQLIKHNNVLDFISNFLYTVSEGMYFKNYNGIKYRVINQCTTTALKNNIFFSFFKSGKNNIAIPFITKRDDKLLTDYVFTQYDQNINLNNTIENKTSKKKFPGGANYCRGIYITSKPVVCSDYKVAYTTLIDRLNLGDETTGIFPASLLLSIWNFLNAISETFSLENDYVLFDYKTHSGFSQSQTKILYHEYVNNGIFCGEKFSFTKENLEKRGNSLVIIIYQKTRSVLANVTSIANDYRALLKQKASFYDNLYNELENLSNNLNDLYGEFEEENEFIDGDEDDENSEKDYASWLVTDESKFIYTIDKRLLSNLNKQDAENEVKTKMINAASRRDAFESLYYLAKINNSSIYGVLGPICPYVCAAITCIVRTSLLSSAHLLQTTYPDLVVRYMDTDSMFFELCDSFKNYKSQIDYFINLKFPYLTLESHVLAVCHFIKTKTILKKKEHSDNIKYTQHVHGPEAWKTLVKYVELHGKNVKTDTDIYNLFLNFYIYIKEKHISFFYHTIKVKENYATNVPAKELKNYLAEHFTALKDNFKQTIYYKLLHSDYNKTLYRPVIELNDQNEVSKTVNLYKFFLPMFMIVYYIVHGYLSTNNQPFYVYLSPKEMLKMNFKAYLFLINDNIEDSLLEDITDKDIQESSTLIEEEES
ncbi:DNA polymerase B [Gryllus bimaculatus nudivirus]|uniref:DNA polymerase B n=1 Tax=Gryllus bimaculatus nudivirus TaxID=432587 RepID=A4L1X5_9VIRU|nr:DNA polymerase B [Gryllus bimaculatus nudivirus]ABO45345.1 DNA polymerase B [Gryllus bimaculatus nudivirus]